MFLFMVKLSDLFKFCYIFFLGQLDPLFPYYHT